MIRTILCFGFFLISASGFSVRISGSLYVFPRGENIPVKPVFVLNGVHDSKEILEGLNIRYPIYLKGPNQIIPLRVLKKLNCGEDILQVTVKPIFTLSKNTNYVMVIDSLSEYHQNFIPKNALEWKTSSIDDNNKPKWIQYPEYKHLCIGYKGLNLVFCYRSSEESALGILVKAKNEFTGQLSEFIVSGKIKNTIYISPFSLSQLKVDINHTFYLSLMDEAGNLSDEFKISIRDNKVIEDESDNSCDCKKEEALDHSKNQTFNIYYLCFFAGILLALFLPVVWIVSQRRKKRN